MEPGTYQVRLKLADPDYRWIIPEKKFEDTAQAAKEPEEVRTTKEDQIVSFTINTLPVDAAVISGIRDKAYTGRALTQDPVVETPDRAVTLAEGRDYTYTLENNVNVGKATVRIKGMGNCSGETTRTFRIGPKGTRITKLTRGKKSVAVKWKRQSAKMSTSRITGYQIQVATDQKFTKHKKTVTVKGWKKTSGKVSRLKAGKKYYVRARTFKKTDGVKCYSPWSKVRLIKIR